MKIKKPLLVLILLAMTNIGFSQQDPQYTQYMYNMNIVNPAYAGSKGDLSIGILGRKQWVNLDGAPKTLTFNIHGALKKSVGLGFSAIYDEIGPSKETNLYGDFSFTIKTSENGNLAFGLKGGATFQKVDLVSIVTTDPDDPLFSQNIDNVYPTFGAGLYYYTERLYIGLSAPNFIKSKHFNQLSGIVSKATERIHYFLTLGILLDLSENLLLKPSGLLKAVSGAPLSIDLSLNLLIHEKFELGLSIRLDDSVSGLVAFQVTPDVRIGYAYDLTTTNLGDFNSGTHEIILLIDFLRKIKSPRFF